jgi:Na+/proline symporter
MFSPGRHSTTTLVLVTATTLYTMSSGFYGVVLTDMVQGVVVIASCVIVSIMAWHLVPGVAELAQTAEHVTGNPDWVKSMPAWHTPMPPGYEAYSPLIMMAGFYLLRNVIGAWAAARRPGTSARAATARPDCSRCCRA